MAEVAMNAIPLEADEHGILRIVGTRVPFHNLVNEFLSGASPEEIASSYPSVPLAAIYSLIGHYLNNRVELDARFLQYRLATAAAIERGREQQSGIRERLLARVNSSEASSAPLPG
jgi:uncharacterized protein (DUF433 family)